MALTSLDKDNLNSLFTYLATDELERASIERTLQRNSTSHSKFNMLLQQMEFLGKQAKLIIEQAEVSNKLHDAKCNFIKTPGKTYHFYIKNNELLCSLISPEEWGNPPFEFYGSFSLGYDGEFTKV